MFDWLSLGDNIVKNTINTNKQRLFTIHENINNSAFKNIFLVDVLNKKNFFHLHFAYKILKNALNLVHFEPN